MDSFLSKNLKNLRRYKQLSQTELADKLEVTRNRIASYESSSAEPKLKVLQRYAEFFDVGIDDLLNRDLSDERQLVKARHHISTAGEGVKNNGKQAAEDQVIINDDEVLRDFVQKNYQIANMVNGFKAYKDLRVKMDGADAAAEGLISAANLLYLLEYLLDINKKLIEIINSDQIMIKKSS